jgi:hypothetical protein
MDVTNPGQVSVESETYGNPDPNGGQSKWSPRELDFLTAAADEGYPPAANGVDSVVFPTPGEVDVDQLPVLLPVLSSPVPAASEVSVAGQSIGQGAMVPIDPSDPAAGTMFLTPADFIVVGPAESFQTNTTEVDLVTVTIVAVLDADSLPNPATVNTTRYYLVTAPPTLTSYPVSMLGRQLTFATDTLTVTDQGAARLITSYGGNFVVVNRDDPTPSNGDVPTLAVPQVGDTFQLDVNRQGSEQVNTVGGTVDVFVLPPPPPFTPSFAPPMQDDGNFDVSTGPQPGTPSITSGTQVPTARFVSVPDQSAVVGLPQNFYA